MSLTERLTDELTNMVDEAIRKNKFSTYDEWQKSIAAIVDAGNQINNQLEVIKRIQHFATGGCDLSASDRLKCIAKECEALLGTRS